MKRVLILAVLVLMLNGCDVLDPGRAEAEREVKSMLFDPESAQFSGVQRIPETGAICGFVNAKNRMGGYAGDRIFAFKDGTTLLAPTEEQLEQYGALFADATRRIKGGVSKKQLESILAEIEPKQEEFLRLKEVLETANELCRVGDTRN